MKRPAIFFDRDNTLIANDGYLGDPNGVVLIEGAADAVAKARRLGYVTVVVSNQSGVARGMFSEEAVRAVNARVDQLLAEANPAAIIDRHEFCPYHPEAVVERYRQDSDLRKPKPGMIVRAAKQLALDVERSWMIGDGARDMDAGSAAGCRTILFQSPDVKASPEARIKPRTEPDLTCTTLTEAMNFIEQHPEPPAPPTAPEPEPVSSRSAEPSASRLETLAEQILHELKHRHEHPQSDFAVTKVLGGVMQMLSLAVLVYAYFEPAERQTLLMLAIALQTLTISLLIMGRK
jgi:D-glycero-D-manno-heptose 1,7-bisphosphate phosphatase